jgi:hypothetical protein
VTISRKNSTQRHRETHAVVLLSIQASIKLEPSIDHFPSSLQTVTNLLISLIMQHTSSNTKKISKHFMNINEHTVQSLEKLTKQNRLINT